MSADRTPGPRTSGESIGRALIVEDESSVRELLTLIARDCGFDCEECESAESAWGLLEEQSFDMVLLDIRLPGASGEELLRQLRNEGSDTPVVVVSGLHDVAVRVRLFEAGADDYVTKPFDIAELALRVRAVHRRSSGARSRGIFEDRLVLHPASRRIASASVAARCTSIEFGILWLLATRPGECVSASTMCREVMGDDSAGCISSLRSHINHVRTKLDGIACGVELQTLRDQGYRLVLPE